MLGVVFGMAVALVFSSILKKEKKRTKKWKRKARNKGKKEQDHE